MLLLDKSRLDSELRLADWKRPASKPPPASASRALPVN